MDSVMVLSVPDGGTAAHAAVVRVRERPVSARFQRDFLVRKVFWGRAKNDLDIRFQGSGCAIALTS